LNENVGGGARPRLSWIDNINSQTGLGLDDVLKMAEARVQWRKADHSVANRWMKED